MKKNKNLFIIIFITLLIGFVYVLGFSSNVSYGNADVTFAQELADFNAKVQPFNNLIFYGLIILLLILLGCILTNSHNRKKYELANIISVGVMAGGMTIFAIVNLVSLPSFITQYKAILVSIPEEIERMNRISSLIPTINFYIAGIIISVAMLSLAIYTTIFLVLKLKNQKEYLAIRNEVLANEI